MSARTLVLILGAVIFSAAGQLFLKAGARAVTATAGAPFLLSAARDARVVAGLAAWIASTVCWLYVLRVAPLSRAYLLTSLTYVIIPIAGVLLFGEHLRRAHIAGMILILAGVMLLLGGD